MFYNYIWNLKKKNYNEFLLKWLLFKISQYHGEGGWVRYNLEEKEYENNGVKYNLWNHLSML